jgi:DNA-binding CsgD family transcriptional regulator
VLARAEYAAGAWDDAALHAQRAVDIAVDSELVLPAFVWDAPVAVAAARGDFALAEAHLAQAAMQASHCADRTAWLGVTRALIAVARGEPHDVLAALLPLQAIQPRAAIDEPGFWPWPDAYADALVSAGRLDEAAEFIASHLTLAAQRGRRSALARLSRSRAKLAAARGDVDAAQTDFLDALEHGRKLPMPYELALTRMAMGGFLRRAGHRNTAAEQLSEARVALATLGARPALERCERELEACGLVPRRRTVAAAPAQLTPTERSVARLVASGLSNRDVASQLVVSVKTVEYHLTRIYAKLGLRSRAALAARGRGGGDDPFGTPGAGTDRRPLGDPQG